MASADEVSRRDFVSTSASGPGDAATVSRLAGDARDSKPETLEGAAQLAGAAEAGANVHAFDPDEDPQKKAAKAKAQAKAQLQPVDGAKVGRTNRGSGSFLHKLFRFER